jgi:hypothetical protein
MLWKFKTLSAETALHDVKNLYFGFTDNFPVAIETAKLYLLDFLASELLPIISRRVPQLSECRAIPAGHFCGDRDVINFIPADLCNILKYRCFCAAARSL